MNWRAAGCLVVGSVLFVAIGLFGLSLATSRVGCFDELRTGDGAYRGSGAVVASPALPGGGQAVKIGSTLVGLASRAVYGPAGTDVNDPSAPRPAEIAVECGDGTYQGYVLEAAAPSPS
ncbi:MAG TPA: hypothetical protein VFL73_09140 [Solirubrobacteraceae bacterium]|nr:hypothetical protein [Solirubrobacteraceae bacterium]